MAQKCTKCGVIGGCGCLFTQIEGKLICGVCSGKATLEKAAEIKHLQRSQGIISKGDTMAIKSVVAQQINGQAKAAAKIPTPKPTFVRTYNGNVQLFHADNTPADMHNILAKRSAFLICGGPSLNMINPKSFNKRGMISMAINNAAAIVKPNFWISGDIPGRFVEQIWHDPSIVKFVANQQRDKFPRIRDKNGNLINDVKPTHRMPNTWFYNRREWFDPYRFLSDQGFPWGGESTFNDTSGTAWCKTTMLLAIKMLWYLGAGTVYLVGCDFRMEAAKPAYAFDQDKTTEAMKKDNAVYKALNYRFSLLKPHFDEIGFRVVNCTPNSGLTVFPYVKFEDAVKSATEECGGEIITKGMYELPD